MNSGLISFIFHVLEGWMLISGGATLEKCQPMRLVHCLLLKRTKGLSQSEVIALFIATKLVLTN